jgi:hypothetical protein
MQRLDHAHHHDPYQFLLILMLCRDRRYADITKEGAPTIVESAFFLCRHPVA